MENLKTPKEYGYVVKDGFCLFQRGPLSQWYGGFQGQTGGFDVININTSIYHCDNINEIFNSLSMAKHVFDIDKSYYVNTCEKWMMLNKAALFKDFNILQSIKSTSNPKFAKDCGRQISNFEQSLWDKFKFDIVYIGNLEKFKQNVKLKEFLLSFSKDTIFAEAAPWDPIWGIGLGPKDIKALDINKWEGENLLGKVIQKVRKEID